MRGCESLGLYSSMGLRLRLCLGSGELLRGVIDWLSGCALPERDPVGTLKSGISVRYHTPRDRRLT